MTKAARAGIAWKSSKRKLVSVKAELAAIKTLLDEREASSQDEPAIEERDRRLIRGR